MFILGQKNTKFMKHGLSTKTLNLMKLFTNIGKKVAILKIYSENKCFSFLVILTLKKITNLRWFFGETDIILDDGYPTSH